VEYVQGNTDVDHVMVHPALTAHRMDFRLSR
jgi:hypothetical protein